MVCFQDVIRVGVIDSRGCEDTISVSIVDIADPYIDIDTVGSVSCFGGNDGFIELSGFSGTPPYLFSLNGGPFTPSSSFTNLVAGSYQVIMEDSISCQFSLFFDIFEPAPLRPLVRSFEAYRL